MTTHAGQQVTATRVGISGNRNLVISMATSALAKIELRGVGRMMRTRKRKRSDATIQKHVQILEQLALVNGGKLPTFKWLNRHGYFSSYDIMCQYPAAFAHIEREQERKYGIYDGHNAVCHAVAILPPNNGVLAPAKFKSLADYDIQGARLSPTELRISEGLDEKEWVQLGRALAHVCMSTYWWIGDFISYGKRNYGVKISYDLAQQATAFTRNVLHHCTYVAKAFPPERRVEALTFYHHSILAKFLPEIADKLLLEAVEYGYTARQVREMADDIIGKKKKEKKETGTEVTFRLPDNMYAELTERASSPLHHFIPFVIISGWLEQQRNGAGQ